MSEDNTKSQDDNSATSLPFEEYVRRQLALLLKEQRELLGELTRGDFMTEDSAKPHDDKAASEPPFEEYVKRQFELVFTRLDSFETSIRAEMVERFIQLSRQIRDLYQKVDIFVREQIYIKGDIRELRATQDPRH